MAGQVNVVNRTAAAPYVTGAKLQSQNTKELFDLLRPERMTGAGAEKQQVTDKAAQQLLENIKKQLVSSDSGMALAGLKKFLDAAAFLNNKAGSSVMSDPQLLKAMLKPENLLKELHSQQKGASIFKGEFFDGLRQLLQQSKSLSPQQQEKVKESVVNVLRQYANTYLKAQQAAEGPRSQAPQTPPSPAQLDPKAVKPDGQARTADSSFQKAEVLLQKSLDTLTETVKEAAPRFTALKANIEELKPSIAQVMISQIADGKEAQQSSSMDKMLHVILSKLEESAGNDTLRLFGEQFVRGLLNTNTMNQPILHFVLPLLFENLSAFAEMYVDPDAEDPGGPGKGGSGGKATRVFVTVDLDELGKAEIDIILAGDKLYTGLYYPPEMQEAFAEAKGYITAVTQNAGFSVGEINIEPLMVSHPLKEIVSKPLERRMALDAKV